MSNDLAKALSICSIWFNCHDIHIWGVPFPLERRQRRRFIALHQSCHFGGGDFLYQSSN